MSRRRLDALELITTSKVRGSARLLILMAYALRANPDGVAWPAVQTLADETHIDLRDVRKYRDDLVEAGELEIVESSRGRRSNTYQVVRLAPQPGEYPPRSEPRRTRGLSPTFNGPNRGPTGGPTRGLTRGPTRGPTRGIVPPEVEVEVEDELELASKQEEEEPEYKDLRQAIPELRAAIRTPEYRTHRRHQSKRTGA